MAGDPRLSSDARRKLKQEMGAMWALAERPCAKCGKAIDYTRTWDLDEIVARMHGGDPLDRANVQPAHGGCNRSAGASMGNRARARRASSAGPNGYRSTASRRLDRSRDW
jgi:5-methylcytosine-specific restriction endonuclease McrA